jgi:hypothetical protein
MPITFSVNGRQVDVDAPSETPLLWILREYLKMQPHAHAPRTRPGGAQGLSRAERSTRSSTEPHWPASSACDAVGRRCRGGRLQSIWSSSDRLTHRL